MKYRISLYLAVFLFPFFLHADEKALFSSIKPRSIAQYLAFYELYPHCPEGQKALQKAWRLLSGEDLLYPLQPSQIEGLINLLNRVPNQEPPLLSPMELNFIEHLTRHLKNRSLRGYNIFNEKELIDLPTEEIDLSRASILTQLEDAPPYFKIRSYEAMIDLMALQIRANLPENSSPEETIDAMNALLFEKMRYRFPPKSKYAEAIDVYTYLPSVLDSRQGVCLGVSILYLSVAQRLGLPLEAVTPPGHIYVRYRQGNSTINVETTARGIHIPSEDYLNPSIKSLEPRDFKELIGLAHVNHAALFLKEENYSQALASYLKAKPYLPNNRQLLELMACCNLFLENVDEGRSLLEEAVLLKEEGGVKSTFPEDFLAGHADIEAIRAVFTPQEDKEASISKKIAILKEALIRNPNFREGWQTLANAWLQLHRSKEALLAFERYHALDADDASIEYALSNLYTSRMDYKKAWKHLRRAEEITASKGYSSKLLKNLRRELVLASVE